MGHLFITARINFNQRLQNKNYFEFFISNINILNLKNYSDDIVAERLWDISEQIVTDY